MQLKERNISPKNLALLQLYSPLIFSLFYFIGPFYATLKAWEIALVIIIFVVQVGLYHIIATSKKHTVSFVAMLCSLVLGVGSTSINQTAYSFYWFSAYFSAARYSFSNALGVMLLIVLCVGLSAFLFHLNFGWYFFSALIPSIGLFIYGLYDKQERRHRDTKQRSEEQIQQLAKVAERERIARDLHDVMGHSLTTIALKAQLANKHAQAGNTREAKQEIKEVEHVSRETLSEMRSIINGYKARSLQQHVEQLIESLTKWEFNVEHKLDFPELNATHESTVSLVLTEAITNIIKHCNGDSVSLRTENKPLNHPSAEWALHIQDNGRAVDIKNGNGLVGMRERLEAIRAILDINTQNGMHISVYFRAHQVAS